MGSRMSSKNKCKKRSLWEAMGYRGCPICHVLDREEADFIAQLQYQILKEPNIRQEVVSANGYCNYHFYQMGRMASPMGIAVLSRDLIDAEIKVIERGSLEGMGLVDCPICKFIRKREESYLREFGVLLSEESFQKEYEATDGLCQIHWVRALDLLGEEKRRFLIMTQMMHLKLLKSELEMLISRGPTSRDLGDEKNSWWVAIEKMVGKKGLKVDSPRGLTVIHG